MNRIFSYTVLIISLSLAGSAAYYSVFGISKLFSAQAVAVAIMAGTLEAAKLITATYLHRFWKKINWLMKTYLTSAVVILMFITSLGIYGFLTSAYQTTANELSIMDKEITIINLKKQRYQEQLNGYVQEKTQLANSITELTKGLSNNKVQWRDKETGQILTSTSSSTRKVLTSQLNDMKQQRNKVSLKIESLTDSVTSLDLNILDIESNSTVTNEICF
jgi:predicted lactoylglutathione lyase